MRETLHIHLRDAAPEAPVAWATLAGPPGPSIAIEHGPLEAALALAPGRRVVLFVPAADVRLTTVQVPARQAQKVLQAAPYALEDQLAEDVDTLHFAIGSGPRRRAADPHPVAIVARERMDRWLAPFRARSVRVEAVVPEILGLPLPEEGRWTGLAEAGRVAVRTGPCAGFSCALADFESYLQLADPPAMTPLRLYLSADVEYDFTRLGRPIELMPGQAILEALVRHWREDTSINLLQGAYSQKAEWQGFGRPWRIAAAVAAGWAVVALAGAAVQGLRGGAELRRLEQANVERYQSLFPGTTRFDNLALQAQQQLVVLRGGGAARAPMLDLLDVLAASLVANPGLTLRSLQFREGALYLSLAGTDLQALESLRAWYSARPGTLMSVQDTNVAPDGVQIRLRLAPA